MKKFFFNKVISNIIRCSIMTVICSFVGFVLLLFAYMLPTTTIEQRVKNAAAVMGEEDGAWPKLLHKDYSKVDNYTDAEFLLLAATETQDGLIDKALQCFEYTSEDANTPVDVVIGFANGDELGITNSAARYWNGYLILLKPLLMLVGYLRIREISFAIETLLFFYLFYLLCCDNKKRKYAMPLVCVYVALSPINIAISISFSYIYYCALLACIIIVKIKNIDHWIQDNRLQSLFCLIGVCSAYFSMNLCVVFPLGMALILLAICYEDNFEIKKVFLLFLELCISWMIGFFGMYICKWIYVFLFTDANQVKAVVNNILFRVGTKTNFEEKFSRAEAVFLNLRILFANTGVVILCAFELVYCCLKGIKYKNKLRLDSFSFFYLLVAMLPFIWGWVFSNHIYIHSWCNYRSFSVTIFAIFCMMVRLLEHKNNNSCQNSLSERCGD